MPRYLLSTLFERIWTRKSAPQNRLRMHQSRPLAAQVEMLEGRTLLTTFLGAAGGFAVLGGTAVANTGPTAVVGDLGVSPGITVTGFLPGTVNNGTIHKADAAAIQAQSDLAIAYNTVAGYTTTANLGAQNLGGMTLDPGVYRFATSAQLNGILTLDAKGDPNAEFDFQIGSTFTSAANAQIVMINGGNPSNIFWQVGTSATLSAGTAFEGHLLARTGITAAAGVTVDGNLLTRSGTVTLNSDAVTIPVFAAGRISGQKFDDLNGDGIRQASECGVPCVTIFLDANNNGLADPGETSIKTDVNGNYSFTNLPPGTYRVREVEPTGFMQTTINPAAITLAVNQAVSGVTFGNFQLISICGTKFQDTNASGVRNPGEPGLAGVTIFLDCNNNGILDPGEKSTTTNANGNYAFSNLGPGTYHVREVEPAGFMQTTINPPAVVAVSGHNVSGILFGNFQLATICGTKFQDTNGNGIRDSGEPGLKGVTIFLDCNNNGVLNACEISTVTDASGNYSFSNLAPGTYHVREVNPPDFVQMTNNPAAIIVTTSGSHVKGILFGDAPVCTLVVCSKLLFTGGNLVKLLDGTFAKEANFVANLYQTLLCRAPDLNGLEYYLRLLMAGYNETQVTAMFKVDQKV